MNKLGLRILRKLGILNRFNFEVTIFLNGQDFSIPILESVGYDHLFMSEPWMVEVISKVIQVEEGQFIDVGVNIGQTLLKLRSVSKRMDYIGFEPNPVCVNYVHRLMADNDLSHTAIIPVGISDRTGLGELHFFDDTETDSSASILEDVRPTQKIFKKEFIPLVEWKTIESQLQLGTSAILKIDVEGAELEVLQSMSSYIEQSKPIILIEILPAYSAENLARINRQSEIEKLFANYNYVLHRVIKSDNRFVKLERIESFGIHGDLSACDYVVVPESKLTKFYKAV